MVEQTVQAISQPKRHGAVVQRMKKYAKFLLAMGVLSLLLIPQAQAISTGTYKLLNHCCGNANPPPYGLRLDELLGPPNNYDYTFDFEAPGSNMELQWDGNNIYILGTAVGGPVSGGNYAGPTSLWNINFVYTTGITQPGTDGGPLNDLIVKADNQNFGFLTNGTDTFYLEDQSKNPGTTNDLAFQFGDAGGGGHRGESLAGWGWLNYGSQNCRTEVCTHVYASDWLFAAEFESSETTVPEPTTLALFSTGLAGLGLLEIPKEPFSKIKVHTSYRYNLLSF